MCRRNQHVYVYPHKPGLSEYLVLLFGSPYDSFQQCLNRHHPRWVICMCICRGALLDQQQCPSYGVAFFRTSDQSLISIATFPNVPDSSIGLGITLDGTLYLATFDGIVLVNTSTQSYAGLLNYWSGPTDIAVAPDGATVYVTNSGDPDTPSQSVPTVSVIRGAFSSQQ